MALDILVVDDERDIRDLVSGVLTDEGYECRVAGDSGSALQMVDERRPSLVPRRTPRVAARARPKTKSDPRSRGVESTAVRRAEKPEPGKTEGWPLHLPTSIPVITL